MASVDASSSPATLSWFSARSHWPSTHRSWNRNTRSLASLGLARTWSCSSFSAAAVSPWRSACWAADGSFDMAVSGSVLLHAAGRADEGARSLFVALGVLAVVADLDRLV